MKKVCAAVYVILSFLGSSLLLCADEEKAHPVDTILMRFFATGRLDADGVREVARSNVDSAAIRSGLQDVGLFELECLLKHLLTFCRDRLCPEHDSSASLVRREPLQDCCECKAQGICFCLTIVTEVLLHNREVPRESSLFAQLLMLLQDDKDFLRKLSRQGRSPNFERHIAQLLSGESDSVEKSASGVLPRVADVERRWGDEVYDSDDCGETVSLSGSTGSQESLTVQTGALTAELHLRERDFGQVERLCFQSIRSGVHDESVLENLDKICDSTARGNRCKAVVCGIRGISADKREGSCLWEELGEDDEHFMQMIARKVSDACLDTVLKFLKEAFEMGDEQSNYYLWLIYGTKRCWERNSKEAMHWLNRLSNTDYIVLRKYAQSLERVVGEVDELESRDELLLYVEEQTGEKGGLSRGHWCELGRMYLLGSGVEKNEKEALSLLWASACGGDLQAYKLLADCVLGVIDSSICEQMVFANMPGCHTTMLAPLVETIILTALKNDKTLKRGGELLFRFARDFAFDMVEVCVSHIKGLVDLVVLGVPGSDHIAILLEKLAEHDAGFKEQALDHKVVQCRLGIIYAEGKGVKRDINKGFVWLEKSAHLGYAASQFALAEMIGNNLFCMGLRRLCAKPSQEMIKWCRCAAEQGHVQAQYTLGKNFESGMWCVKSDVEAVKWYKLAAEKGHVDAQVSLGFMYSFDMKGIDATLECAEELVQRVEEEVGGLSIGSLSRRKRTERVEQDYDEAEKWLLMAARCSFRGKLHLALLYANTESIMRNDEQALRLLVECAEKGKMASANSMLGFRYYCGVGVGRDEKLGVAYCLKAAELGDDKAREYLVEFAQGGLFGVGGNADAKAALAVLARKENPSAGAGAGGRS